MPAETSVFRFRHEAMATVFEVRIRGEDSERDYFAQAAREVFQEVDRLETLLSRFHEGSDVFRINRLVQGEQIRVSFECHECLKMAIKVKEATGGAFDPAVGGVMMAVRGEGEEGTIAGCGETVSRAFDAFAQGSLVVDATEAGVVCTVPGLRLDFGGIGKGYALDQAVPILRRWKIEDALLIAGGSSARGLGRSGWEADLAGDHFRQTVQLRERATGGSGIGVQGNHIVDPRRKVLESRHRRAWALADTATLADALSTAAMTMSAQEILEALPRLEASFGQHCAVVMESWENGSPFQWIASKVDKDHPLGT